MTFQYPYIRGTEFTRGHSAHPKRIEHNNAQVEESTFNYLIFYRDTPYDSNITPI
jgi:hypothetical protein